MKPCPTVLSQQNVCYDIDSGFLEAINNLTQANVVPAQPQPTFSLSSYQEQIKSYLGHISHSLRAMPQTLFPWYTLENDNLIFRYCNIVTTSAAATVAEVASTGFE